MAFDGNGTLFVMDEKKASSPQAKSASNFPVVPVAVCISLLVVALIVVAILYIIRRHSRRHDYIPISKEAIKPELNTVPENTVGGLPSKVSSEDSLAPLSSDDMYYDARDDDSDRESKSIPFRETSPVRTKDMYPEGHIGRLWFSAAYDSNSESLTVVLQKIENLPDRSEAVKTCDPCVKISLLPSNKQVAQSRYKRKNKNPVFNEKFEINLPSFELNKSTLCLTVVDGYRANQQTLIGHVLYPLKELYNNAEVQKDLIKPAEAASKLGQLHVSLSYYPTLHRLTAIILRATNLQKSTHRQTDSFVKVSFSIGNKVMKTKKTVVHTETQSPMFNESFNFTVNEDDLGTSTLLISVMHSGGGLVEDKVIGRVLLGGRMYARGRACDHWIDMMNNPRKMVKCWHELQGF